MKRRTFLKSLGAALAVAAIPFKAVAKRMGWRVTCGDKVLAEGQASDDWQRFAVKVPGTRNVFSGYIRGEGGSLNIGTNGLRVRGPMHVEFKGRSEG